MPLYGSRSLARLEEGAPRVTALDLEPWTLPGAQILQVMFELRQESMLPLLPPALHPTIPPTLLAVVTRVPDSPVGPFAMAEVLVGCRAGARPRGLGLRGYVTTAAAAQELRARWAYPVEVGEVSLTPGYDRVRATVRVDGREVLDVALLDPEAISGSDIQYLARMHLGLVEREGAVLPRLVQVDPEFAFSKADRGRPEWALLDAEAWSVPGAEPWWPVSASHAVAEIAMPRVRYMVDPARPAIEGLERIGQV